MPGDVRRPLVAAVACLAGLVLLASAAYSAGPIARLDLRIFLHFVGENSAAVGPANLAIHLGDLGPLLALTAAVAILGMYFGRRREVVAALAVIVGANLTSQVLKIVLEHPRHVSPAGAGPAWARLLPTADAFPSGHTTAAASIGVALLFVVPAGYRLSAALAAAALTAAMAISVVVLTWHYPSDALGAILVTATWGFLMLAVLRRLDSRGSEARHTVHEPLARHGRPPRPGPASPS